MQIVRCNKFVQFLSCSVVKMGSFRHSDVLTTSIFSIELCRPNGSWYWGRRFKFTFRESDGLNA
jgi:hypothetical protein